jgi:hypothetical protein
VVVLVGAPGEVARIDIPWRRRDADPANRHLIVTDAAGQRIANVVRVLVNRERAELLFEPAAGRATTSTSCRGRARDAATIRA